jgi:succinate dehydrogenase/fumarate reductase-like Fe-S protein
MTKILQTLPMLNQKKQNRKTEPKQQSASKELQACIHNFYLVGNCNSDQVSLLFAIFQNNIFQL